MTREYKLVGLSKGKRATLELLDTDKEIFWAKVEKFRSLWDYCKNNWHDIKIAQVRCDYVTEEGIPVNAILEKFGNLAEL